MLILGIETSCDDTSLAIVQDGTKILAHVTASQVAIHNKTGGIVPEIAAREHAITILPVLDKVLRDAALSIMDIDAISVTKGPGLVSSLLVGTIVASTLGIVTQKPVIPVHHIEAHIYGNWLGRQNNEFRFPILILTASGGHNDLIIMKDHGTYLPIAHTRDDAAGEAFDKVSRILGLGYPGGPAIAKAALDGKNDSIPLPRPYLPGSLDFSFSGVKSEVLRIVEKEIQHKKKLTLSFIHNLSASFQQCIVDVLSYKLFAAAEHYKIKEVHLAGGVSANKLLQETVLEQAKKRGIRIKVPLQSNYSTDNGAMIASCGYYQFHRDKRWAVNTKWSTILPEPNMSLV